jgi:hypothetical protein
MSTFTSNDQAVPAVKGEFTGTGNVFINDGGKGVEGHSQNGFGVYGHSEIGRGVVARSDTNYGLRASSNTLSAARCTSVAGVGVEGESQGAAPGVVGSSASGNGVEGRASTGTGVLGTSSNGPGIHGIGRTSGVLGESNTRHGIEGISKSKTGAGVAGDHKNGGTGVAGVSNSGFGVFGKSDSGHAGFFQGDVFVTGVLGVGKDIVLSNGDCAEDFDVALDDIEPGMVMVLGDDESLHQSSKAYDKRVAGVVSGAGKFKPGIILDKQPSSIVNRRPIALLGKVYCKVDADLGSIEVGDMLTTSSTKGHAMKANDPLKAFGSIIGKALKPLLSGKDLIPILVALQ